MKSLFNEYNAISGVGLEISEKADKFSEEIVKEYKALGYNTREICHIISLSVSVTESEDVLRDAMKKRKEERCLLNWKE